MPSRRRRRVSRLIANFAGDDSPGGHGISRRRADLRRRARRGVVKGDQGGTKIANFIDLRNEVNPPATAPAGHRRLHPKFLTNRYVYLLYAVDPVYGRRESADQGPFHPARALSSTSAKPGKHRRPGFAENHLWQNAAGRLSGVRVDALGGALRFAPTTAC